MVLFSFELTHFLLTLVFDLLTLFSAIRLIKETSYPLLEDSNSVAAYPHVRGMTEDVFFFDHDHPENGDEDEDSKSKTNAYEVEMVVGLTVYLIHQGYSGRELTIITPYTGQLTKLRAALIKKSIDCEDIPESDNDLAADIHRSDSDKSFNGYGAAQIVEAQFCQSSTL